MRVSIWVAVVITLTAHPLLAQHVDTLTDADLVLAGLKVGDRAVTARQILGAPTTASPGRLVYPGLTIILDAKALCEEFVVTGPNWSTIRGLRVGDSVARVFQLYGDWASTRDSSLVLYERSTDDPSKNGLGLMVLLRAGRITTIKIGAVIDAS